MALVYDGDLFLSLHIVANHLTYYKCVFKPTIALGKSYNKPEIPR